MTPQSQHDVMPTPSSFSEKNSSFPSNLPPPTDASIARVKEGLAAARSPVVKGMIEDSLNHAEAMSQGQRDHHLSGNLRRISIRFLVRALFRVQVEYQERLPNQPTILAANHLSHIDPFLLLSEMPAYPYYYILGDARSLYNKSWKRLLLNIAGGTIPLQRIWKEEIAVIKAAKAGKKSLQALANAIEQDVPTGTSIQNLPEMLS